MELNKYRADLHIHTVLSPCGDIYMSPSAIIEQAKKLHLDIFYYFQEGDDYYSIIARKHETKEWKEANATDGFPCDRSYVPMCDFQKQNFLGIQVYMPTKTDEWLRSIYSDSYMTPIKNWNAKDYKTRIVPSEERSYRRII